MTPGLLDQPLRGGLYRVRPEPGLEQALAEAGWSVAPLRSKEPRGFLAEVGPALGFPAYYGANLDALADCLSELEQPTAVVWRGWGDAALGDPPTWSRLLLVLRQASAGPVPFALVLAEA
ncbi:MAG: barstar family protein [Actinomycetia bacterium]|nr:barstar family protein [Actinomycetes bacterium]